MRLPRWFCKIGIILEEQIQDFLFEGGFFEEKLQIAVNWWNFLNTYIKIPVRLFEANGYRKNADSNQAAIKIACPYGSQTLHQFRRKELQALILSMMNPAQISLLFIGALSSQYPPGYHVATSSALKIIGMLHMRATRPATVISFDRQNTWLIVKFKNFPITCFCLYCCGEILAVLYPLSARVT